jgi:hypothetical protein
VRFAFLLTGIAGASCLGIGCGRDSGSRDGTVTVWQTFAGDEGGAFAGFSTTSSVRGNILGEDGPCIKYDRNTAANIVSAGNIDISGTIAPITLVYTTTGPGAPYSPSIEPPPPIFAAGATIEVIAMGSQGKDDLPAFMGEVTAPAPPLCQGSCRVVRT